MDLIFWLDTVPVCCKGIFSAVAQKWDGITYFVCAGQLDENRKKIISDGADSSDKEKYVYLVAESEDFLHQFIEKHKEDVHIFGGYRGKIINQVIKRTAGKRVFVWAERPCPPAQKERFPWILFHKYFALKYRKKIAGLFPLGVSGVKSYEKYGWPKDKMFPLLYLPVLNESIPLREKINEESRTVKFIYLGRFTNKSKGTDVLMEAVRQLKEKNYTLDMVGGYGDYAEKTKSWIEKQENVKFGGTWPIGEVCERLCKYDVCVIPSKYEGWNVTLNEALMAGIGCIATDECVSDEMITASGAGCVVRAGSSKELAEAMDDVMRNPEKINEWSKKAYDYRKYMTADVCANYFMDVINYQTAPHENTERPVAPWLI